LQRVENAGDLPALANVRSSLEQALGVTFDAEKGEHFFRSTLVQTLFYGVFSAWVLWARETPRSSPKFQWRNLASNRAVYPHPVRSNRESDAFAAAAPH
jgi:hypothetical protein